MEGLTDSPLKIHVSLWLGKKHWHTSNKTLNIDVCTWNRCADLKLLAASFGGY
jgi:hypothetical protein